MNSDEDKTSVVPKTDAKQLAIEVAAFATSAESHRQWTAQIHLSTSFLMSQFLWSGKRTIGCLNPRSLGIQLWQIR